MDAAFSVYLSFLRVRVALKLRALRVHTPRRKIGMPPKTGMNQDMPMIPVQILSTN